MSESKSIFDALNDIRESKGYKYEDGQMKDKEDSANKIDKSKQDVLKKVRKKSQNAKTLDDEEKEVDTGQNKNSEVGNDMEVSNDNINKLKDVLKALKVPERIETAFDNEDMEIVAEYLEENHDIRLDIDKVGESKESQEETENIPESNEVDEKEEVVEEPEFKSNLEGLYTLKDNIILGVMEDGYATVDTRKWDSSVLVFESYKDDVGLEYLDRKDDFGKFKLSLVDESIEREIYLDIDEINKILRG